MKNESESTPLCV